MSIGKYRGQKWKGCPPQSEQPACIRCCGLPPPTVLLQGLESSVMVVQCYGG